MDAYAKVVCSTDEKWEAYVKKFEADRRVLRAKGVEQRKRFSELTTRQAALAEKHGGSKAKGSDKIKLNVGGTRVTARRETLCQFPTTRLAALFSGRWENRLLRDKKGRIFLDVNPTCFKKIVDFLNLMKIADPEDPPSLPEVAPEDQATFDRLCDFFGMTEALTPAIDADSCKPRLGESAIIHDPAHETAVVGWLGEAGYGGAELELLYRASRDGWEASQFHATCDHQGATLTVIKSTGGFIFGGFLDAPWKSDGSYFSSDKAFLYTLHCHAGLPPTKLERGGERADSRYEGYGGSTYGAVFGCGHDIYIAHNAHQDTRSYTNVGKSYNVPAGYTYGVNSQIFLTGSRNFRPAEVEVFRVAVRKGAATPQPEVEVELDWSTMVFDGHTAELGEALAQEQRALHGVEAKLQALEEKFGTEEAFIEFFASGETKDVVDLDVSGEKMTVKRSTLMLCKESALARSFDDAVWKQDVNDSEDSDSEGEGTMIEQSAYCFGKIVNQLRLRAIVLPGETLPPPPSVVEHERKNFQRVVSYYFPGVEDFIFTPPPLPSSKRRRLR